MAGTSGILRVGEAQSAIRSIAARQRGSLFTYYGIMIALMIAGGLAGFAADTFLRRSDGSLGLVFGMMTGWLIYVLLCKKFLLSRFRRRLADRGISLELPLSLELTPDRLVYTVGDVQQSANWKAVTELFESHGYWIFLVQASAWFAPKRFFAEATAEQSFIRDALANLTDEARSRSPDAKKFVSG